MSDELVAFIKARLDEDEAVARTASWASPEWREESSWLHDLRHPLPSQRRTLPAGAELLTDAEAPHIARHDPARVSREVEAKRRIVDWCAEVVGGRDISRYGEFGALKDDRDALAVTLAVETLRLLALPYADHADYRQEWSP